MMKALKRLLELEGLEARVAALEEAAEKRPAKEPENSNQTIPADIISEWLNGQK